MTLARRKNASGVAFRSHSASHAIITLAITHDDANVKDYFTFLHLVTELNPDLGTSLLVFLEGLQYFLETTVVIANGTSLLEVEVRLCRIPSQAVTMAKTYLALVRFVPD